MAAAELPAWDQPAPTAPSAPEPLRGPAMGPVAQMEAGREYSLEELEVLQNANKPKEYTIEELDMEAARLFDDPTYSPTRDEYFELKATKERLKAEGKLPGTAELAAKAVGGLFVTAADLFYTMAVDPEGSVTRIPETLNRINQGTLKEPKSEALAKAPASLQTGIGRAALGAMQLGGWAKEAIQGTPKYRDEETGEFFFYNNEVQLQNALDAGRKLRPTTDDDLKDHEFQNYIAQKRIDAEYQDLGEKTAPTELLTRLITGRNQQETPNIAQAGALEIVADPTNLIPLGAGAKTLGLSRLGKTVSAQTAGVISKVAGGVADGGDALANRFTDVVANATGFTPRDLSTAGKVLNFGKNLSIGGGIAAGANAIGMPPEVTATIAGFYPAYKAGIGVLRKIETGAGAAKIILRESADATNGLDQAARAAVLANPSVPQVFKEVLERPSNFVPIESTPARLAAEQSLSPQMRGLMGKLSNPAIVQSVRGASALAKGAVKGTAINAPFSLLAANAGDDEEAAAMLGAGATFGALGGGVDRFTGLQQRRQQAAISDVSRMLVDVELAGGDVGKMMSTQTPESLVKLASLQGTFRNGLDLIPLNATDYNANVSANGGAGSAGLFVQAPAGQRAKVYINLDAKRQGIEPHEFGHALLASGALDGQQKFAARAWVDKTYGAEGIKARAAEYASNIIRAKNAEAFPDGNFEITSTTLASEMESLTQGGLARGDMDGLDWARDEIFAETFAKASETMDFNAIRRGAPAGGNFLTFAEGILGAQARALSASGVRIDPQTGAPLEKPADLFAKNPLLATDKALVKQLGTYINNYRQWANNPGHEKPAGVRVAPSGRASDIANNPQVTFYDRGDGIKANAFAIQDPVTGQAILRDQRDLNAAHAKVREQLKALGGSKLRPENDPYLGPRKDKDSNRTQIRGKLLPQQFDFLNGFMPHIRNFARQFEQFGQTGESMQVRYHAIGSGDTGAFRIKNLGNLEAITREVLPFEWQLTKAGNLNAVVLDLTQFRNRALRAINDRNDALAPFNFEIGQLEADLKVWMDNHRNNLPGENKIGTEKRDAINALVGLATTQNRAKNPLNGSFGPGSAIKQFRLDRVDAAIGTGRQGFHFDYDKANGNRLPEIQSPLPDLSQDLPGQGMPDIAVVPERFTGTGQETGRQSRFVKPPPFFSRYSIESYEKGGKFFDTQTGEDLTGKSFGAGFIDVIHRKPRLFVDGEPNTQAAASGRTYRTNLFKQKAGWQWISSNAPQTSTIVSVEGGGRHVYALRADFEGGVDLARYSDKPSEPRLRPTAKGELLLGTEVGRINIRGKEHSVYDTARIAAPQGQAMPDAVPDPNAPAQQGYKVPEIYKVIPGPNGKFRVINAEGKKVTDYPTLEKATARATKENNLLAPMSDLKKLFNREDRQAITDAQKRITEVAKNNPEATRLEIQLDETGLPKIDLLEDADGNPILDEKGNQVRGVVFAKKEYELRKAPGLSKDDNVAVKQGVALLLPEAKRVLGIPAIAAGKGWYGRMRDFLQRSFGANIEVFGQLLGATSARTPVDTNFKQALEAVRLVALGKYDDLLQRFDAHVMDIKAKAESGQLKQEWLQKNPNKRESLFVLNDEYRKAINTFKDVPLRDNGAKYNANSQKVLHALYGIWLSQTKGPKTPNFAGNLTGRTLRATIDVWAARNLRRLLYSNKIKKWRILPEQESGVKFTVDKAGNYGGDFEFGQRIYDEVARQLNMNPDDLQAVMWFAEKDVWETNGWTNIVGAEKSSFDKEAGKLNLDRYQIGLTTFTDAGSFDPKVQEAERINFRNAVRKVPNLAVARVSESSGLYGGTLEPTFDVEFSVQRDPKIESQNYLDPTIRQALAIADRRGQIDVLTSLVVDADHPNARPMVEVGFKSPAKPAEIDAVVEAFKANGIDGFTIAKNERGDVLGLRSQYVPEISARYDTLDHLDPAKFVQYADEWIDKAEMSLAQIQTIDNVSYRKKGHVSSAVYGKEEYTKVTPADLRRTGAATELGRRRSILSPGS